MRWEVNKVATNEMKIIIIHEKKNNNEKFNIVYAPPIFSFLNVYLFINENYVHGIHYQ